jgi:uncharacterized protein YbjT (DUF2867 family)
MNALKNVGETLDIHNLDREPGKIFITDGSGVIGHRIAEKLFDSGYAHVRVGTTDTQNESLHHMSEKGADVVLFSWDREETYSNALIGIKSVIITIPYHQYGYKHFSVFLIACKKANVKHFVKISFYLSNIPGTCQLPFTKHHTNCDEMLMNLIMPDYEHLSQMSYTILSASHCMSNLIKSSELGCHGTESLPHSDWVKTDHACNYISPNDVAEAAVRVVLSPHDHYNRVHTLLGPEMITRHDILNLISKCSDQNIERADVGVSDDRGVLQGTNPPSPIVQDHVAMQLGMASSFEKNIVKHLQNDFERICGHSPEIFTEYFDNSDTMTSLESGVSMFI